MNKNQKTQKVGYRLFVNRSSLQGEANWEYAGYLFSSRYEADCYRVQKHSSIKKFRIEGVRLNTVPVSFFKDSK